MQVSVESVWIPKNRQRQKIDAGKVSELAVSIKAHGMFHPVVLAVIDKEKTPEAPAKCQFQLIAGYRRLLAHALLKEPLIDATLKESLSRLELEEIELDENIMREQLSWQDEVRAKARLVDVRKELYGDSIRDTAEHVGESRGELWEDQRLAKAMEIVPELAESKNKTQAQNKLRLLVRRQGLTEKAEELAAKAGKLAPHLQSFEHKIKLGDCTEISKAWSAGVYHCVITDPPYGIDLDKGETKKGNIHPVIYEDDAYDIMDLYSRVSKEAFRVLQDNTHAYFFFDIKAYTKVFRILQDAGFTVEPIPLIWVKPGPGQVNHPENRWASGYETAFFCRKGNRALLKQGQSNVLHHDPVPPGKKIHPTEKPLSLIRQLIESSTAPGEIVVDFFGGSGSTAEAALQTGRNFLLCEKDPSFHAGIMERLGAAVMKNEQQIKQSITTQTPLRAEMQKRLDEEEDEDAKDEKDEKDKKDEEYEENEDEEDEDEEDEDLENEDEEDEDLENEEDKDKKSKKD